MTISSVVVSNLQISEDIIDRGLAALLETTFDGIFILERLAGSEKRLEGERRPLNSDQFWQILIDSE